MMPRTVRWISAVRGSMKVSESASALATMTDFSSGVMYRWCGSLPVGMRLTSLPSQGVHHADAGIQGIQHEDRGVPGLGKGRRQ